MWHAWHTLEIIQELVISYNTMSRYLAENGVDEDEAKLILEYVFKESFNELLEKIGVRSNNPIMAAKTIAYLSAFSQT